MGRQDRFSISRKTAFVTGATSGTGAEITRVFAEAGAAVIASDRSCEQLSHTAFAYRGRNRRGNDRGGHIGGSGLRVSDAGSSVAVFPDRHTGEQRRAASELFRRRPRHDNDRESGSALSSDPCLRPGAEQRKDHQHLFADRSHRAGESCSLSGFQRGLNALTKSPVAELAPHNIQVNAVCPTVVMTEMGRKIWSPPEKSGPMIAGTLLGRFGKQVEAADMALYLASPASDLVNGAVMMIARRYSSV